MSKKINIYGSYSSITGQLFFDEFGVGISGFSLQKLRAGYTGACMRVLRTSDNTEMDIGFVNDTLDTTTLLSFVGASNGAVTIWYNQGSGIVNAVETVVVDMPLIVISGSLVIRNGDPALQFSNSKLTVLTQYGNTDTRSHFSIFEINNTIAHTGYHNVYLFGLTDFTSGFFQHIYHNSPNLINFNKRVNILDFNSIVSPDNTIRLSSEIKNSVSITTYLNDQNLGTKLGVFNYEDTLMIGWWSSNRLGGYIQEMITYNEDKGVQATQIIDNRNSYYNIF